MSGQCCNFEDFSAFQSHLSSHGFNLFLVDIALAPFAGICRVGQFQNHIHICPYKDRKKRVLMKSPGDMIPREFLTREWTLLFFTFSR